MFRTFLLLLAACSLATAFVVSPQTAAISTTPSTASASASASASATRLHIFNKKKNDDEDLSFIESRDMTRDEMKELNQKNEDIMNAELIGMTIFSLIISVPMLYLVWVGFFAETVEFGEL